MNTQIAVGVSCLLVAGHGARQASREPSGLEVRHIEACEIRLTHQSGSADFVGRWTYGVTVKADGAVEGVRLLDDPIKTAPFVELTDFEACIRRWRFVKPGSYDVQLHGGTMSPRWLISVSIGAASMRVDIPRKH